MIAIPIDKPKNRNKCPFTCEALQFFNGKDRPQSCPLIEIDLVRCGECKYQYMCGHQIKRNGLTLKLTCCEYGERRADEHTD